MQLNNFIYSCLYKQLFDNAQPIAFICVQNYPLKINLHSGSFFTFQPPFAADPKVFFENDCRKRKYSLQSLFEAVLYLLVTGCQWRMLPRDFPNKCQSVYKFFRKRREDGHIEYFIEKTIMRIRRKRKPSECPTVGALDAQSVKWGNRHSHNGFDANKKVKGIKRNIVVDRNGFILGRTVDNAGKQDSKLAHPLCRQTSFFWPTLRKILWTEGIAEKLLIR